MDLAGKEAKGRTKALSAGGKLVEEAFCNEVEALIGVFRLKILFEGHDVRFNCFW